MKLRPFIASMGAVGVLLGCGTETGSEVAESSPAVVQLAMVEQGEIPVVVTVVGTTEPYARAFPGTRLMGRIKTVQVSEGDAVHKDQVLARIESRDLEARRLQAEAALREAQAVLVNVERNLKRMRNLLEENAVTQQKLDDVEMGYTRAQAAVSAAREGVEEVEEHLRYATVRSPLDGYVVQKSVEEGDMANPGVQLFTVEQLDPARITVAVGERDLAFVQVGREVEVEIRSIGMTMNARVEALIPAADPGSHTFRMKVTVPNPDGAIGSGMFARVRFTKESRAALLVPAGAIVSRGQLRGVYALVGDRVRLRWVRLGKPAGDRVEVLSGLEAGTRVVVEGMDSLHDGQTVAEKGNG